MAYVWANSMSCHPRATCHIAGCNNSIRHIKNLFSPYFILFLFLNAVWALTNGGFRIVSDTLVVIIIIIIFFFGPYYYYYYYYYTIRYDTIMCI